MKYYFRRAFVVHESAANVITSPLISSIRRNPTGENKLSLKRVEAFIGKIKLYD